MFSLLRRLFFVVILAVVLAFMFRGYVLSWSLNYFAQKKTGCTVQVESIDFSTFQPPILYAYNLQVQNPPSFETPNLLYATRVEARGSSDFWQNPGEPRLSRLSLAISEFAIVRNVAGEVNVLAIEQQALNTPVEQRSSPLIFDLELSVEKVVFYDYRPGNNQAQPQVIEVKMKGLRYRNVQNVPQLERLLIREVLRRAYFPSLGPEVYRTLGVR